MIGHRLVAVALIVLAACAPARPEPRRSAPRPPYAPEQLAVLSKVILTVKDFYVDPARIRPRAMVTEALRAAARRYPRMRVDGDARSPRLVLSVGVARHEVNLAEVEGIWRIRTALQPAVAFLSRELADDPEVRWVEEPLIQGMLSALDAESALLTNAFDRRQGSPAGDDAVPVTLVAPLAAARPLPGGVGYLRLAHLGTGAAREVASALARVRAEAGRPLRGVVLDLRGNGGGLLEETWRVSDLFIAEGAMGRVVARGRPSEPREARSEPGDELGAPIVVLVGPTTAAGAEAVAAALRDRRGAILVGDRTYGRGSIQTYVELEGPRGAAILKLTIAELQTPDGHPVAEGLAPDLAVEARPPPGPGESEDDLIALAREILARARSPEREALLAAARELRPAHPAPAAAPP